MHEEVAAVTQPGRRVLDRGKSAGAEIGVELGQSLRERRIDADVVAE